MLSCLPSHPITRSPFDSMWSLNTSLYWTDNETDSTTVRHHIPVVVVFSLATASSVVIDLSQYPHHVPETSQFLLNIDNVTIGSHLSTRGPIPSEHTHPSFLYFGLQSTSSWYSQVRSVSLVPNSDNYGEVIFDQTSQEFQETCFPESVIELNLIGHRGWMFRLGFMTSTNNTEPVVEWISEWAEFGFHANPRNTILMSNQRVGQRVMEQLLRAQSASMIEAGDFVCDSATIDRLSPVVITITRMEPLHNDNMTIPYLVIYPEDYMVTATCQSKFAYIPAPGIRNSFDLLQLPRMNFRFTQTTVSLCDPLF